jgi:hypothetical protein
MMTEMPLIEIHALAQPEGVDLATISTKVNAAVARALGCKLEAVWTVWLTIDGPIAHGNEVSGAATKAAYGPIVHIYHHRTPEQVERVTEAIETVLSRELSLARGDVFVTSQPVAIAETSLS